MKQFLCFAMTAVLAAAPMTAFSAAVVTEEGLAFSVSPDLKTAQFTGLSGEAGSQVTKLVIPASVSQDGTEYKVTSLAPNCCDNNPNLRSVALGEYVEEIGDFAFRNCTGISSVSFNEGLKSIGASSFYKCQSITGLTLPSTLESIGDLAFYGASAIPSVEIPAATESVGIGSFATCRSIKQFTVADGNISYAAADGVLFNKDQSMLVAYPIGDTRNSYSTPATVKIIAPHSMRNSTYLTSVELNEGLDSIGSSAFTLGRLTSVNLPASVRAIGFQAFTAMPSITAFNVASGNENYKAVDGMLLTADGKRLLFGVGGMADVVVPEGVEEVAGYSFYTFYGVKTLKLASTTTKVGDCAFYSNSMLSSVDFGPALESIGETAFRRCNMLTTLNFPASLKEIGRTAFAESVGFTEVQLNEGLEHLGEMAFARCYGLKKLSIPSTVSTMDYGVFVYCNQLEEVELAEGLKSIGNACFNECSAMKQINFPSSLETIGEFAFMLAGLPEVNLNEGLRSIGAAAFEMGKFQKLELPSTLETIGEFAFAWNFELLYVSCGENLKTIGDYAFSGCSDLTVMLLNEGLKEIGAGVLGSCETIQDLEIPSTVTYVGAECFAEAKSLRMLKMLPTTPPATGGDLFTVWFDGYSIVELNVPGYSEEAYMDDSIWGKFRNITCDWSGVEEAEDQVPVVTTLYTLDGRIAENPGNGVYVARMSDGSVRKIMINK